MRLKLIVLVIITTFNFLHGSNIVEINYDTTKIKQFNLSYLLDGHDSITLSTLKNKKFKTISSQHSFGNSTSTLWVKIDIHNTTDIPKEIYLHNDFAYFSKNITIFEFLDNKLIDKNIYDIFEKDNNHLTGSVLIYPLNLKKKSLTTLYIKIEPIVTLAANFKIYDKKNSLLALITKNLFSNAIVIILLALAFYNIFLYLFNRKKELLYYALYLINTAFGLSYMYGSIFHNLQVYGQEIYWINITSILVSAFLALFIKSIFNFQRYNQILNTLLNSIIALVILDVLVALFIDLALSINLISYIYLYSYFVILYIAYCLYKEKHPLANIFITAYSIYIVGFTLTILSLFGFMTINSYLFHASGVSLVIEALLFSYLIHYHTKLLQDELSEQKNALIVKNQKAQMGDMIGAITHQWKQPLANIGSIVMLLQTKFKKNELDIKVISKKINLIDENIHFLSDTIDDFKNFFSPNKVKTSCDLDKLINKAIALGNDDMLNNNILIKQDLQFTKEINIFQNELLHIILNILQNAKEAFKNNPINTNKLNMIKIIGMTKDDLTYIDIIDNAGGISELNLPYIFHQSYTTKKSNTAQGLGLYLSKVIIQDHMNGSIEVKNIGDGSMFRIIL